jgi:hypothetical protein
MIHGYQVALEPRDCASVPETVLEEGSRSAAMALSTLSRVWMERLRRLADRPRNELEGRDYCDASVLEYAICKALEAAYRRSGGEPPEPLTRDSFALRIFMTN